MGEVRLHVRVFLGFAALAGAGRLFVFLRQSMRTNRLGPEGKKPPVDDLN